MILQDSFYFIKSQHQLDQSIAAIIEFNPDHEIFKGHFPGNPVTPGVCMIQIIREFIESVFNIQVSLINANEIKFLSMIVPTLNKEVHIDIQYKIEQQDIMTVNASIFHEDVILFKFKGKFLTSQN